MRRVITLMAILLAAANLCVASDTGPGVTPEQAIQRLQEGNSRFQAAKSVHPHIDASTLHKTAAEGQHPFATVLTCSDSRVPVELVFDYGVGDIFVVRVAGNVCGVHEAGAIEYGVDHLKTPVLVVLGHSGCGAVTAVATDAKLHGNIPALVRSIRPAVEDAKKDHPDLHGKELVPAATQCNVWHAIADLFAQSPMTRELVAEGKLKVVGAIYQLDNGKIEWLGPHPEQARLLKDKSDPTKDGHGAQHARDAHKS